MPHAQKQIELATIGFTQTTARHFFERLRDAGVKTVIDIRLHNTSQLAGFAKADDLAFFLDALVGIGYVHEPRLAPTDTLLKTYRNNRHGWPQFSQQFLALMAERHIETWLTADMLDHACLLCAEASAEGCHRQLVCDYLEEKWPGRLKVRHL